MNTDFCVSHESLLLYTVILTAVGAVGAVGLSELSERRMTVTEHGHCRESLSDCRDYCRTTVGLSGSVGLLSEVTVGLSDRGSGSNGLAPGMKLRAARLLGLDSRCCLVIIGCDG